MYDFDRVIDRHGKNSAKWDERFIGKGDRELLPFWVADTDFPAPESVQKALRDCVEHNLYGYSLPPADCAGEAVRWQKRRHGFDVKEEFAVFIAGIDAAMAISIRAFTEPGDGVLIQTPVYAPFFEIPERNGRRVLENPMRLVNGRYEPDFEDFEKKAKDAKIWMFCNPQNPSGRCFTKEELQRFAQICLENDVLIVSDEIHADIIFDGRKHIPIASLSPEICARTITCTSASKTFSVAGLAASVIFISDEKLRKRFEEEKDRCCINTNSLGLAAMEAAYRDGDLYADEVAAYLQDNRDYALDFIAKRLPGIKVLKPEATFLLWIDCSGLGIEGENLEKFFRSAGVLLSMGSNYREPTGQFVRLNFGCRRSVLEEGLERIEKAIDKRKKMKTYKFWGWEQANISPVTEEYPKIHTPGDLYDALSEIWCAKTCAPRLSDRWTKENRSLGQCSITAFLAQDIFGGKVYGILRPGGNYHCFNEIGDCRFDLTSEQFGEEVLNYDNCKEQFREIHFSKEEKRLRYEYLKAALKENRG